MPVKVTTNTFNTEVLESKIPVVVDFWAQWCRPCLMVAPILEEIASEYEGRVKIAKINVDEEPALANQYRIASIPTMLLFQNGEIKNQVIGVMRKEDLIKRLGL